MRDQERVRARFGLRARFAAPLATLCAAIVAFAAGCNDSRRAPAADSSVTRTTATAAGSLADDAPALSSPRFDSVDALARTGVLDVRHVVLREPADTATPLTDADTSAYAAPTTQFTLLTDSTGSLHRVDYEPSTPTGDWTGTYSFLLDSANHVEVARLDVVTLATDCASPVRVLEEWTRASNARRRYVLDQDNQPLADLSCGESVPPLDSSITDVEHLVAKKMLPPNWRALVTGASAAPTATPATPVRPPR